MIASLSITVLVTRVFLNLTGYPQVGDSTYHVAHVLWGGLLLFVAVALPLSIVNRYALWASSILGGIGAGLFIDEVGKFITQSNDYFFPLAFPIIYGFILICVWLYWRIRRHQPRDTRTLLYHALEDMKQVLDNDLDPFEHRELVTELKQVVAQAQDPNELRLAESLLAYAQSRELRLATQPNLAERLIEALRGTLANRPAKWVLKGILLIGFGLISVNAIAKLIGLVGLVMKEGPLHAALSEVVVVSGKSQYVVNNTTLLLATTLLVIATGLLALIAVILLLTGRDIVGPADRHAGADLLAVHRQFPDVLLPAVVCAARSGRPGVPVGRRQPVSLAVPGCGQPPGAAGRWRPGLTDSVPQHILAPPHHAQSTRHRLRSWCHVLGKQNERATIVARSLWMARAPSPRRTESPGVR